MVSCQLGAAYESCGWWRASFFLPRRKEIDDVVMCSKRKGYPLDAKLMLVFFVNKR